MKSALEAMAGIAPRDEVEGMLAAQMVACHSAAMDCYRRAMLPEQTSEGRKMNLNFATKLTRTYALHMEALDKPPIAGEVFERPVVQRLPTAPLG